MKTLKYVPCKFVSFRKDGRFYFTGYEDKYVIRGYIDSSSFNYRDGKHIANEVYRCGVYFLKDFSGYIIKNMETGEVIEDLNWSLVNPKPLG